MLDAGPFGAILAPLLPFVTGYVGDEVRTRLGSWAGPVLRAAVAADLALAALRDDATLSVRDVSVTPDGISAQTVLGCVSTTLSTCRPAPLPAP